MEDEGRPPTRLALDVHAPPQTPRDREDGGEPHPRAESQRLGGEEGLEDAGLRPLVHARPRVADGETNGTLGLHARGLLVRAHDLGLDRERTALEHRVARVGRQVHEDLLELNRIGEHHPAGCPGPDLDVDVLADEPFEEGRRRTEHVVDAGGSWVGVLLATEGHQLPDQPRATPDRVDDALEVDLAALGGVVAREGNRGAPRDPLQQVPEVVRDGARQRTHRLHLLRLPQLLLERPLGGDVLDDADGAGPLALDGLEREEASSDPAHLAAWPADTKLLLEGDTRLEPGLGAQQARARSAG